MHAEYDTLNVFPIKQNDNIQPNVYNDYGDFSCSILLDGWLLCDTIVPENICFIINRITTKIYSVLSYLHINCAKYGV